MYTLKVVCLFTQLEDGTVKATLLLCDLHYTINESAQPFISFKMPCQFTSCHDKRN